MDKSNSILCVSTALNYHEVPAAGGQAWGRKMGLMLLRVLPESDIKYSAIHQGDKGVNKLMGFWH